MLGLLTLELGHLRLGNHCASASALGIVNKSCVLLALLLLDRKLPWADILDIEELLLGLRLDWVHRGHSIGSLLLEALFDVSARMPGEITVVKAILSLLLESHVRLDVLHLAWEIVRVVGVVLSELLELEILESLVDVLLFDLLPVNTKVLVEVHHADIVLGFSNPSHSIVVWLDVVNPFDLGGIKILLQSNFFRKVSEILKILPLGIDLFRTTLISDVFE